MLLGENLSRRHQCPLKSALDRREKARNGHNSLSTADVALQETMHWMRLAQVFRDFRDRACLCAREWKREIGDELFDEGAPCVMRDPPSSGLDFFLALHQHGLHTQQLVERESTSSRFLFLHRFREVDGTHRLEA